MAGAGGIASRPGNSISSQNTALALPSSRCTRVGSFSVDAAALAPGSGRSATMSDGDAGSRRSTRRAVSRRRARCRFASFAQALTQAKPQATRPGSIAASACSNRRPRAGTCPSRSKRTEAKNMQRAVRLRKRAGSRPDRPRPCARIAARPGSSYPVPIMQIQAGQRPLSLAKLTAPQPNRAWPRARLFERLDAARRGGGIVWVAAPAGSGKTTLVASYLQARRLRAAWYRVDAADADVASFFHYLGQAAKPPSRRKADALPDFTVEYLAGLPVFARNWFRRFFERMQGVPLLVFDDYHQLPADSPVHVALREGLAEVPPGLSVVITSRGEPPPLLTRLRTLENFTLLDREALRMSADECIGVARQRLAAGAFPDASLDAPSRASSSAPDDALLRSLHERTQGWVAGRVLMLERGPASALGEARAAAEPLVFDYFAGELFEQAEPRLQRLLVRTALLPRFTVATASALAGQPDAADLLAELDRRNFFIARHAAAGQRAAYEYHPLFREFLLERGRRQLPPGELAELRSRAAGLLADDGDAPASIALLREAGDWPRLVALVLAQAPALLSSGRFQTLAEWILDVPPAQRDGVPWLGYFLGLCRLPYDPAKARELLSAAYTGFRAAGNAKGEYLAWAGIVDTFIYAWSEFGPADAWIDEFDALRSRHPQFPSHQVEVRAVAAIFAILMYRRPQHPE